MNPQVNIDPLSTPDADRWAREFMRRFQDCKDNIDTDTMRTWFANAIMKGCDWGRNTMKQENITLRNQNFTLRTDAGGLPFELMKHKLDAVQQDRDRLCKDNGELIQEVYQLRREREAKTRLADEVNEKFRSVEQALSAVLIERDVAQSANSGYRARIARLGQQVLELQIELIKVQQTPPSVEGAKMRQLAEDIATQGTPLVKDGGINCDNLREVVEAALTVARAEAAAAHKEVSRMSKIIDKFRVMEERIRAALHGAP